MSTKQFVLVTGTDSGFGSVVVDMLVAKGFGVFATHLIPDTADKLRAKGIVPFQTDITKQESVDAMASGIREHLKAQGGQFFGLVNNAGLLFQSGPVEWTPIENYEKMFAVNCVGAVRVTNSVLPLLRHSQGRIVNVTSLAGKIGAQSQSAYCATKHAVEGWSDCLRREMMDWGVTVHIIEPGVFSRTGLYSTFNDGVQKLWDKLDKSVQDDYGEAYREEFSKRCVSGLNNYGSHDNSLVPKAMMEALTSKRPQYRYMVGPDAKFLLPYNKYMSEAAMDAVLMFEGTIWASKMDRKAGKRALSRYYRPKFFRKIALLAILFWLLKKIRKM